MILSEQDGRLLAVTQNDHAHLAAELLSLWRRDGLPEHPRRRQILVAAREHDNGWREADSAPRCDRETGRPLDFVAISQELRREIWCRGVERFQDRDVWVTLLILQHAIRLHRSLEADTEWAPLLERWRQLRGELLRESAAEAEDLAEDYRWIELSDLCSLGVCGRWRRQSDLHGYGIELEPGKLFLDPFPFAGTTTFRVACRWIDDRPYGGDAAVGVELATARWQQLEVRVAPAR
ncbi:MAG: DUF3891 family protein [Thermoanaerobaculia bacterium]